MDENVTPEAPKDELKVVGGPIEPSEDDTADDEIYDGQPDAGSAQANADGKQDSEAPDA